MEVHLSTITARRTRRYTSTLYIRRTIHGVEYNPMYDGRRYSIKSPIPSNLPPTRPTLTPPFTPGPQRPGVRRETHQGFHRPREDHRPIENRERPRKRPESRDSRHAQHHNDHQPLTLGRGVGTPGTRALRRSGPHRPQVHHRRPGGPREYMKTMMTFDAEAMDKMMEAGASCQPEDADPATNTDPGRIQTPNAKDADIIGPQCSQPQGVGHSPQKGTKNCNRRKSY